jgi:hypothetical protein
MQFDKEPVFLELLECDEHHMSFFISIQEFKAFSVNNIPGISINSTGWVHHAHLTLLLGPDLFEGENICS